MIYKRPHRLTERQRFILKFLERHIRTHGYAPTIREIKSAIEAEGLVTKASGTTSTSVVNHNLNALEEAGYITRGHNKSRASGLVDRPATTDKSHTDSGALQ